MLYSDLDVVYITKGVPDYLHDVLYLGLSKLGCNIIDCPRKPSLHGIPYLGGVSAGFHSDELCGDAKNLLYNLPQNELRKERPDVMFFPAVLNELPPEFRHAWIDEASKFITSMNPHRLIMVDAEDAMEWIHPFFYGYPYDKIFKRDMTLAHGLNFEEISFAASPEAFVFKPFAERKYDISFVASSTSFAFRTVVADFIKLETQRLGLSCFIHVKDEPLRRDKTMDIIADSRVSVSVRGSGVQCYRYFEIPAKGVVMLSDEAKIQIKNDFTHEHCFKFKTLDDLSARLIEIKSMTSDQLELMAIRALAHTNQFHTPLKRAEQVLSPAAAVRSSR